MTVVVLGEGINAALVGEGWEEEGSPMRARVRGAASTAARRRRLISSRRALAAGGRGKWRGDRVRIRMRMPRSSRALEAAAAAGERGRTRGWGLVVEEPLALGPGLLGVDGFELGAVLLTLLRR